LALATLAVYAPVWHHGFLDYDDSGYVSANPRVLAGLTWHSLAWAFNIGYEFNWHPLTWVSHMLDVEVYGLNAGAHHLTNLLLHMVNTILLFEVLRRMTGALGRSAFVAGLFAVHPLHVESVAWIAERKDVLSTLFWMLTLGAYVRYVREARLRRYWIVLLTFALALMAKPMVVTLPFVLLLLDYWPLRRLELGSTQRSSWGNLVWEKWPLFALAAASSIVTLVAQQRGGAVAGLSRVPLDLRLENAMVSYVTYIFKMFWPARLAVFYPYSPPSGWWVIGSMLILLGVSAVAIWAARRHPYLLVGWLWYLGTLVPVIGLVQVGDQPRADRYTYIPLIGLFIMIAWGASHLLSGWSHRPILLPAALIVIAVCSITAHGQVQYWGNSYSLWTRALQVTEGNYLAHNNLGLVLADQGRVDEAVAHYTEALRAKPGYALAHNNLGIALVRQGKIEEAMVHYKEALRINPDYADAHNNLGNALAKQGNSGAAMAQYFEAARIKPDLAEPHNNLGIALASQGRFDEAVAEYSEAIRLRPDYVDAHNNLGVALARQGRLQEAIAHYREALRIRPDYWLAHVSLGNALAAEGKVNEAMVQLTEASRINPGNAMVAKALSDLRSRSGRPGGSP
jgi:protein O-mannosyl-transferase